MHKVDLKLIETDKETNVEPVPCSCGITAVRPGEPRYKNGVVHSLEACGAPDKSTNVPLVYTTHVRKPFTVEAVEVTKDNIEAVARYVGDLKYKDDGTPFILVDRRLVPNVFRVYPGFFMTKMGENVRCYSRKIFHDQFMPMDETVKPWVDFLNKEEVVA